MRVSQSVSHDRRRYLAAQHGLIITADLPGVAGRPSTYYAARSRPPSQRAVDDARLIGEIRRIHQQHYGVYGRRKIWRQLHREDGTRRAADGSQRH